jgi:hypothetical protein
MSSTMERVHVNGAELEVAVQGAGETIVFIHGAGFADSYLCLADDAAVRDHLPDHPIPAPRIRREQPRGQRPDACLGPRE